MFALHYTQHRIADLTEQPIGDAISAKRLTHYGRLMLEMAEGDKVREAAKGVSLNDTPTEAID